MGILDAPSASPRAVSRALSRQRVPITDRSGFGSPSSSTASNGTDLCMNSRYQHAAPIGGYSLVYVYANFMNGGGGETDGLNDIVVRAVHESNTGVLIPVTFAGKRDVTIQPGAYAFSDPIGVRQPVGSSFWSRTNVSVASGGKWPIFYSPVGSAGAAASATYTDLTSGTISTNTTRGYGPVQVLAYPNVAGQPVVALMGDSISAGSNDGDRGWPTRWLNGKYCLQNVSFSNSRMNHWAGTSAANWRRSPLLDSATDVVVALGINDLITGQATTLAAFQTSANTVWGIFAERGVRVHAATILPSTDSTDSWATTGNQTTRSYEALRVQINNWIRTLPSPLTSVVEAADAAETARNSGIWKAGYCDGSSAGLHPSATGATAIAAALPALPLGLPNGV